VTQPPPWPERPVIVCGTAGGVGTSVIAALLADHRAATTLGESSWWIDAAGNDGDLELRMRAGGDPDLLRSTFGTGLYLAHDEDTISESVAYAWGQGAVPVVDAGARALSVLPDLAEGPLAQHMIPVLVLSPRPDLLNRARIYLDQWQRMGVLSRTIIVINPQVPDIDPRPLQDLVVAAVSGEVAGVIALEYDPVLGAGTGLDRSAQEKLDQSKRDALRELEIASGSRP